MTRLAARLGLDTTVYSVEGFVDQLAAQAGGQTTEQATAQEDTPSA